MYLIQASKLSLLVFPIGFYPYLLPWLAGLGQQVRLLDECVSYTSSL